MNTERVIDSLARLVGVAAVTASLHSEPRPVFANESNKSTSETTLVLPNNPTCEPTYIGYGLNRGAYAAAQLYNPSVQSEGKFCTPKENKEVIHNTYDKGLGIFWNGNFMSKEDVEKWSDMHITKAKSMNANELSITIPFRVDGIRATTAFLDDDKGVGTPSQESLAIFFDKAHKAGIATSLRLTVDENDLREKSGKPTTWRGAIDPTSAGAETFFENYGNNVIFPFAEFAKEHKIGSLTLGVELEALQKYTAQWDKLAKGAAAKTGDTTKLSIDYNFATFSSPNSLLIKEAIKLAQISEIDEIGIDEYSPIKISLGNGRYHEDPTEDEMVQALEPHMQMIRNFKDETGKPVKITETGIRPQTGAIIDPWNSTVDESKINYDLQSKYLRAVKRSSDGIVSGIKIWGKLFYQHKGEVNLQNIPFSITDTPTEEVVREMYK